MIKNEAEFWEIEGYEFKPSSKYYKNSKPYRLWIEYLRLSPTYWLAHKHCSGYKRGLNKEERQSLPKDFDQVIQTYKSIGDIYKNPFRFWWTRENGANVFGFQVDHPEISNLAFIGKGHQTNKVYCKQQIDSYINNREAFTDPFDYLLLAVPLSRSRLETIKDFTQIISHHEFEQKKIDSQHFKLSGERFRYDALKIGLRLLWIKCHEPKLTNWRLGVKAGISKKYGHLDISITKLNDEMRECTPIIESITSRALQKSLYVMENAARGQFPCKTKVDLPLLDYSYMSKRIDRCQDSSIKASKRRYSIMKNGEILVSPHAALFCSDLADDFLTNSPSFRDYAKNAVKEFRLEFIEDQNKIHKLSKS